MTELVVRRLLIDLAAPFERRWNGGDAFSSAFFNALSMSFPQGEQYFIDSVRAGLKALPEAERQGLAAEVQGFVGQEATHRRIHALFNEQLLKQGFDNQIEGRAQRRVQANAHYNVRIHVAATAATEHMTALFADWMLRHPGVLAGAEPRLQTLWQWHSAEETEHRSTAFDLYRALGGNEKYRLKVFKTVTVIFLSDVLRQTVRNLWHDGSLFRAATWAGGYRLLWARDGLMRSNVRGWRDYLAPNFHPDQHDGRLSARWLQEHAGAFAVVARPTAV